MSIQPTELRLRLAARDARNRVEGERRQASLAWLTQSCSALAEEEGDAVSTVEALSLHVPGKPAARRKLEAWARSNAAFGLALEVETRRWCRALDAARAVRP